MARLLRIRPSLAPVLRPARITRPGLGLAMRMRYNSTTTPSNTTTPTPADVAKAATAAAAKTAVEEAHAEGKSAVNAAIETVKAEAPAATVKPAFDTVPLVPKAKPAQAGDDAISATETVKAAASEAKTTADTATEEVKAAVSDATKSATETVKEAAADAAKAAAPVVAKAAVSETVKSATETAKSTVEGVKTAAADTTTTVKETAKSAAETVKAATPPPPPPTPSPSARPGGSSSAGSGLRTAFYMTTVGATLFAVLLYGTDTRASVHRWIVPPLIRTLYPDAEDAHHIGTEALKVLHRLGLNPKDRTDEIRNVHKNVLEGSAFEYSLSNPVGISAGLDKDADIPDALFDLGAAVVEVGGCTPLPQAGNPRPRVFRVPSVEGLVNRYGLNSVGADALASRLRTRLRAFSRAHGLSEADVLSGAAGVPVGSLREGKILAVQMAKQKDTPEGDVAAVAQDYVYCVRRLAPYADILVVNVSSPNTPGLRDLQAVEPLTKILAAVVDEAKKTAAPSSSAAAHTAAVESGLQTLRARAPRVMVKVSPDEDEDSQIDGIVEAVFASGVDGIIVGNTTKRRTGLVPEKLRLRSNEQANLNETGGFSGPAMYDRTLALVGRYRQKLDEQSRSESNSERKTLFASGGVTNGDQALKLLNAGASVAMLYTGLVYGGAGTVTRIKEEMRAQVGEGKKEVASETKA